MKSNTQYGLLFLIIGLIINMIFAIINSMVFFTTNYANYTIISTISGAISAIGSIFILIGAILFFVGRKEFGEKHLNSVNKALMIFVVNIIVAVIFVIIISFVIYSTVSGSLGSANPPSANITDWMPFSIIIFSVISAILGGLIYYFSLIELENEKGKNVLLVAIIFSISISVITSFFVTGMLTDIFGSFSLNQSDYSSYVITQNAGILGLLGILPSSLFIYALYIPYKRIKDGMLFPEIQNNTYQPTPDRICPNCNRPIPEDANICPYCAKRFDTYV